jgi:hypothetical protein
MATGLTQSFIFPTPLSSYEESGRKGMFNSTREDVDPAVVRSILSPTMTPQPMVSAFDREMA